jgi:hypothetical protein
MPTEVWSAERRRAWNIAAYARRFALIARRPEFQIGDRSARAGHALTDGPPGPLPLFDAVSTIGASDLGASDLDRLCGYAVAVLRRGGRGMAMLLDVLGMLDADRLCAIYFALPPERRSAVRRDPIWGYHVQHLESEIPEAEWTLSELIEDTPASEVGYALAREDLARTAN